MVVLLPLFVVAAAGGYGIAAAGLKVKDSLEMRGFGEYVEKLTDEFCDNIRKSVPQYRPCTDTEAYRARLMGE